VGLYLCVFDADEEIDGVEVGHYADFNALREYVRLQLESGQGGSRFPTLMIHSDCDGEWPPAECEKLVAELAELASEMNEKQPVPFTSEWQKFVAKSKGLSPRNAFESFIDVDGEFLLERMQRLAKLAAERNLPILFQ
jgi:Immunity protein 70